MESSAPACSLARRNIQKYMQPLKADISKRFFARDQLFDFLSSGKPNLARQVLECKCHTCTQHRRLVGTGTSTDDYLERILGNSTTLPNYETTAVALFSLFVASGCPQLCRTLLDRRYNDSIFQLAPDAILRRETLRPLWVMEDAEFELDIFSPLERHVAHFAVPHMTAKRFTTYDANTILPFVDEKAIDEGGFGRVSSFNIYPCYNRLGHNGPFARKQLLDADAPLRFELERENHQIVELLQSPHIVKMITTYKQGDKFNIIFLLAKTDLNHYLREADLGGHTLREAPLELCPIWNQALGITRALRSISNVESKGSNLPNVDQRPSLIGFHFDLKPANILVDHDGTWLITDFGLAQFAPSDGSTSRVINQGGTDEYAPPEYLNINGKFSRRYDVWSLGCILLEVVTFAILGHDGLKALDDARRTTTKHRTDSRFFAITADGSSYMVKPSVTRFKDRLLHSDRVTQNSSRRFLVQFLELIDKMLQPLVENRIDINSVIPDLESLLSHGSGTRNRPASSNFPPPSCAEGERDLTSTALRRIRQAIPTYQAKAELTAFDIGYQHTFKFLGHTSCEVRCSLLQS